MKSLVLNLNSLCQVRFLGTCSIRKSMHVNHVYVIINRIQFLNQVTSQFKLSLLDFKVGKVRYWPGSIFGLMCDCLPNIEIRDEEVVLLKLYLLHTCLAKTRSIYNARILLSILITSS